MLVGDAGLALDEHEACVDISRINCLRSLMLDMRTKFAHQIEVLSQFEFWNRDRKTRLVSFQAEYF